MTKSLNHQSGLCVCKKQSVALGLIYSNSGLTYIQKFERDFLLLPGGRAKWGGWIICGWSAFPYSACGVSAYFEWCNKMMCEKIVNMCWFQAAK